MTQSRKEKQKGMFKRIVKWMAIWLAAALCVLLLRRCAVSLVDIPGEGESPVLMAGEKVTVNLWAYGLRLSPMRWWGYVRWAGKRPQRGHWVAFNDPSAASDSVCADEQPLFVGCCYALPGDTLWIDGRGGVHRRRPAGQACKAVKLPCKGERVAITPDNMPWYARIIHLHEGRQAVADGHSLRVEGRVVKNWRFGHDYYWMSSADADNLADSRTFGFVPDVCLIGRLGYIVYSRDARCTPWYDSFRFPRMLMRVGCRQKAQK